MLSSKIIKQCKQYKFPTFSCKHHSLYIPRKDLLFINHPLHGPVYPVYIADEQYNTNNSPKKLMPPILLFSGFNIFLLFSSFQIIPMTLLYKLVYTNELFFLSSAIANYLLLRKYLKYLGDYSSRVKSLYLLPSGSNIIIETFDGAVKKLENLDIYEYNVRNRFHDIKNKVINWIPMLVNNDNNLRIDIKWGRANQNIFEGKSKILDWEILSQIISRKNVDTTIKQFKKQLPLGIYSQEEKRKVIKYLTEKRIRLKRINRFRLSYHFKLLRKQYYESRYKKKVIKEEFKFY